MTLATVILPMLSLVTLIFGARCPSEMGWIHTKTNAARVSHIKFLPFRRAMNKLAHDAMCSIGSKLRSPAKGRVTKGGSFERPYEAVVADKIDVLFNPAKSDAGRGRDSFERIPMRGCSCVVCVAPSPRFNGIETPRNFAYFRLRHCERFLRSDDKRVGWRSNASDSRHFRRCGELSNLEIYGQDTGRRRALEQYLRQ